MRGFYGVFFVIMLGLSPVLSTDTIKEAEEAINALRPVKLPSSEILYKIIIESAQKEKLQGEIDLFLKVTNLHGALAEQEIFPWGVQFMVLFARSDYRKSLRKRGWTSQNLEATYNYLESKTPDIVNAILSTGQPCKPLQTKSCSLLFPSSLPDKVRRKSL